MCKAEQEHEYEISSNACSSKHWKMHMIFHTTHAAFWEHMRLRKQTKIHYNNTKENNKRLPHQCSVGDEACLLLNILLGKNEIDREGPHGIIDAFTNGTVAICRGDII